MTDSAVYLETLLKYYEDEVMGEAYFYGLADHIGGVVEREKLALLAEVERRPPTWFDRFWRNTAWCRGMSRCSKLWARPMSNGTGITAGWS